MKCLKWRVSERGGAFTLIELLIGLAVTALLIGLVASAVDQTVSINASSGARTAAIRQVDVSIDSMRRDIQMAQQVGTSGSNGFPLCLTWKEWDNTTCVVTYWLEGSQLKRGIAINGGTRKDSVLASDISLIQVNNLPYSGGAFNVLITATVGGFKAASESRTFQVFPRTGT
jgi:type II secretory pathway pseudopilin PulG